MLDLTRVIAGPACTQLLAGLGAEVLRIDPPDWDEPAVLPLVMAGKRAARLDAATPTGARRLQALLAGADVLVHGFRAGVIDRLLPARRRPGLIEVAERAYGWSGPWAGRRGFDSLVQFSTGIAAAGRRAIPARRRRSAWPPSTRPRGRRCSPPRRCGSARPGSGTTRWRAAWARTKPPGSEGSGGSRCRGCGAYSRTARAERPRWRA